MDTKDKIKAEKIIKRMESMKKKDYASHELRGSNQMIKRLRRVQDKEFNKNISIGQAKLKDKTFVDDLLYEDNMEDREILELFGIKKRKTKHKRGGIWNF